MHWQDYFRHALDQRQTSGVLRKRTWHVDLSSTVFVGADGRQLVNFGTNDYLGIRHDERLKHAIAQGATGGAGSGASPLVSGYNTELADLERRIAAWQTAETALVFSSGFAMNVGVISALVGADDLVLSDQLNHASLIDGCRLSKAHKRVFPHNDVAAARAILNSERRRFRRALLICESVYSMDGDQAPLAELTTLCQEFDVGMLVDEAHATGVYGPSGGGLGTSLNLSNQWLGKLGTLSKAIGTCGGFVTGSRALTEFLVNHCRSYIYSTAIAPAVVAGTRAAIELIMQLDERRQRLAQLAVRTRQALKARWKVIDGDSPIVPVIIGKNSEALRLQTKLNQAGCYVPAIRPPTVPEGTARLRISLSAQHTDDQVNQLLECLSCD